MAAGVAVAVCLGVAGNSATGGEELGRLAVGMLNHSAIK